MLFTDTFALKPTAVELFNGSETTPILDIDSSYTHQLMNYQDNSQQDK